MHHPRANIKSLFVKIGNGGKVLIQLESTYKTYTTELKKKLDSIIIRMLQLVNTHEKQKENIQSIKKAINLLYSLTSHKRDIKDEAIEAGKKKKHSSQLKKTQRIRNAGIDKTKTDQ